MKHIYALPARLAFDFNKRSAQAVTNSIAEIQGELFSSPLVGICDHHRYRHSQ